MIPRHLTRPERLGPALAEVTGDDRWLRHQAHLIAGGKSNLTFRLSSAAGTLILRRPPTGPLLPRANGPDAVHRRTVARAELRREQPHAGKSPLSSGLAP